MHGICQQNFKHINYDMIYNSEQIKDNYISTAKAFGIIFMVMGHSGCPTFLHNIIYAFHMPLFFFCSGFLFTSPKKKKKKKKKKNLLFKPLFKKKKKHTRNKKIKNYTGSQKQKNKQREETISTILI
eukprot:TRINITY_DN4140_c0_g1_i2.p3 TRINITY_DN4140_c0_g1~~TRINITY_DN4140_c0_g1_i2.p3  ORF type:complete len:127 (-),score=22.84 TRINITY_DN4140_c0_g1_i2:34-414(-)